MNKRFTALMTTLILSVIFSISASAYDVEVDGIYYNLVSEDKIAEVAKLDTNYSGNKTIPSSIKVNDVDYAVTSIGEFAFRGCSGLTSVTIPNSVTSIGAIAFQYCSSLTSVTIPNSVTSIGDGAFQFCSSLTSITIPNSVTNIGEWTFTDCSSLTSVTIPNSVTSIGNGAFSGCSSLTSVTIPNSVTSIGEYAFIGCSGLKSVIISNSVTSIRSYAFQDCSGLTSVTIPNSVTSIGSWAFSGCSGLTSVTIPNSVTSIEYSAFGSCTNLENVYCYAEKFSSIGGDIFKDSNIEYATLHVPSSALSYYQTTAPWSGFGTIKTLESTDVGTKNDVEVDGIYYNLFSEGNVAKVTRGDKVYSGDITIPSSIKVNDVDYAVTYIGEWAFAYCGRLTSVTIPNSVTSIGESAFQGCSLTSITIPNSVTSIGKYAFEGCSGLTAVTIPNSVTSIGDYAFWNCSGLTSVTIPNSVTSIGDYAFYYCSSLTSVTIPNSVTSIGKGTFNHCSGLISVTIPNSVTSIGEEAFQCCSGLTSVTIPNSVTSIGSSAFWGCSGITSITIPNSVTSIGRDAFGGCTFLTSVTIPNSVTSIGDGAFEGCNSLTSVTIPNSVTSIGDGAFQSCSNLENVYCYAQNFSYIGNNIFIDSYIENATLHVPSSALSYYQTTEPWSGFGTIRTLEGTGGGTKKCETPTISFADGKLTFSCATEEVEYESEVTCSDVNKYYSNEINLAACYDITVTAMKSGFSNSDIATAKLYWLPSSGSLDETSINNVSMRGIAIQSAGGIVTISGLNNDETVSFYAIDGKTLGFSSAINGTTFFAAQSGSVVVAKIGNESIKILVK